MSSPPSQQVPSAWKFSLLPVLFFATLLPSAAPWFIKCICRKRSLHLILSLIGCLAAGILLGVAMCSILPEAHSSWSEYYTLRGESNSSRLVRYPWAFAIAGTIVLLFVTEEQLFFAVGKSHQHRHAQHHQQSSNVTLPHGDDESYDHQPIHAEHEHLLPELHEAGHHHHKQRIISGTFYD